MEDDLEGVDAARVPRRAALVPRPFPGAFPAPSRPFRDPFPGPFPGHDAERADDDALTSGTQFRPHRGQIRNGIGHRGTQSSTRWAEIPAQ